MYRTNFFYRQRLYLPRRLVKVVAMRRNGRNLMSAERRSSCVRASTRKTSIAVAIRPEKHAVVVFNVGHNGGPRVASNTGLQLRQSPQESPIERSDDDRDDIDNKDRRPSSITSFPCVPCSVFSSGGSFVVMGGMGESATSVCHGEEETDGVPRNIRSSFLTRFRWLAKMMTAPEPTFGSTTAPPFNIL